VTDRKLISKYFENSNAKSFYSTYSKNVLRKDSLIPLHLRIWPYEGKLIFLLLGIWCFFGLFILGSASWWVASKEMGDLTYYIKRQFLWYVPSLSIFYLVLKTNIRDLLKISKFIFYVMILLIAGTVLFGTTVNGSSRWLIIGPFQIQPSELIKPFAILEAANIFAHWDLVKNEKKIVSIILFGLLIFLIILQPNLSTAGLTGMLFWIMAFCGGVRLKTLGQVASLGFFSAYLSILRNEYQRLRVISFLNPWDDANNNGYQLIQSLLAIGSGGLFGQGYGLSTQKLQYLPIQSTDFIFAIFAEEFGLLGSIFFLGFLSIFSYLSLRIALNCRNNYTKLVAIGSGTLLIGQSLMHIAVTTGSMPTTGLPLPFVSYGGNSLLSSSFIAALLLRCSLESTGLVGILRVRKAIN
tara:strand:- start:18414 stop:19643 length:1230 start_codon:yes stop_codon:yes gene_type:complete